jgi:ATP-dependent DNA helicase PIF1
MMKQREALAILDSGASVLLTGAAGTGKTYTLNQFIRRARAQGKNVAVTATTGLAATHLSGNTIHAWAGIGVHDELPRKFAEKLSKQRRDLITKADILVIDEISMLHDYRLDMIDTAMRQARGSDKPFGGIQIVLCGDFFQLPPVSRPDSRAGGFITSSNVWQQGNFTVCYLQEQFRQAGDDVYTEILNGIRKGTLMRSQLNLLQSRRDVMVDPFAAQTRLLTTNADVDAINDERLQGIDAEEHAYYMETSGGKQYIEQLKRSCLAPEVLYLKKGASVMCIKNAQDRKYVNGSLGEVIDFDEDTDFPIVKLNNGLRVTIRPDTWELRDGDKKRASLVQLPLRLAWAITVHKSQGMTLDAARVDLSRAFVEGMGYVALSRVKDLRSLVLDGMNGMALRTSPVARQIDGELQAASTAALSTYANDIASWREEDIEKLEKTKKKSSWTDKIAKMRETYPNAYMPWKEEDDIKLLKLHGSGKTTKELTEVFGRHPGSIEKRLERLVETT